ncbi:iron(III) transport system substrate-binding protein [Rhizobiales bacterium GAS191]|nr:iron(III) transport system substrate-binding protein [Rhizobiales bacterium GAS113]SED55322.1 iron(III) transport system substrate-binding protein [Rhizobiales bacterium GAS191]SEE79672.1 iron(III) transport system substrate-binding protein [Rhizobiales bacterium GAS188]
MRDFQRSMIAACVAMGIAAASSAAQAQSGRLVLYTSQPDKDAQETVKAFKTHAPDVDVEIFRSGTIEVMSKLAAEFAGGQPKADVLLIADAVSMEALKLENRLLQYNDAKVDGLREGSIDPERYYFGSKLITTGIVYNTAATLRPDSWGDLAKPEYKGQVAMPSPLYSGAAAIMLSAMTERPDLGWTYFEALQANEAVPMRGNGAVLKSVATGEKPYGVLVDFMALTARQKGSPIAFVFPKEGVPAVTEPVAILKTTQNQAAAKAFVDFILSDEGQKLAVSQGYIPAKTSIPGPIWLPEGVTINIISKNLKSILSHTDADKKRFAEMFGG